MWCRKIMDDKQLMLQGGALKGRDDGEGDDGDAEDSEFVLKAKGRNLRGASRRKYVDLRVTKRKIRNW
jgi:hypothetical protein